MLPLPHMQGTINSALPLQRRWQTTLGLGHGDWDGGRGGFKHPF